MYGKVQKDCKNLVNLVNISYLHRQVLDMLSIQGNSQIPWKDKISKGMDRSHGSAEKSFDFHTDLSIHEGFFRGRDSRQERLDLVKLSKENPDLLDAGITRYFFFRDQEKSVGKKDHISIFEFFKVNLNAFEINLLRFLLLTHSEQIKKTCKDDPCLSIYNLSHLSFPVQISNQPGRHRGRVPSSLFDGRRIDDFQAGFALLRAFLQSTPAVGALRPD